MNNAGLAVILIICLFVFAFVGRAIIESIISFGFSFAHWALTILLLFALIRFLISFFTGKKKRWFTWSSWLCTACGGLALLLSVAHLFGGSSIPDQLDAFRFARLYNSDWWVDRLLLGCRWVFSLTGITLMLGCPATRKKTAWALFGYYLCGLMFLVLLSDLVVKNDSIMEAIASLWAGGLAHACGVLGMLFGKRYAHTMPPHRPTKKELASQQAAQQAQKNPVNTLQPQKKTDTSRIDALRSREKELQRMKKIYGDMPPPEESTNQAAAAPAAAAEPVPATPAPVAVPQADPVPLQEDFQPVSVSRAPESDFKPEAIPDEAAASNPSVDKLLQAAAGRLFLTGPMLATLDGQRQVLIWLAEGVPCLKELPASSAGRQLLDPGLKDDPECFLGPLGQVANEAARMLHRCDWPEEQQRLEALSPESRCGGWHALRCYDKFSADPDIFAQAELVLEETMRQSPAWEWLLENGMPEIRETGE